MSSSVRPPSGRDRGGAAFWRPVGLARSLREAAATVRRCEVLGPHPVRGLGSLSVHAAAEGGSLLAVASWAAARWPDRPALIHEGESVSFRELVEAAARRGAVLSERLGDTRRPCVAVLGRNSVTYVEWLLACAHHGADVVLLNPMLATEQLVSAAGGRRPHVVVCDDEFEPAVADAGLVAVSINTRPQRPVRLGTRARFSRVRRRHRATVVLMTSGTGGPAKLVTRDPSRIALVSTALSLVERLDVRAGEPTLLTLPLLHGHGLATLGLTLAMGAPLHLASSTQGDELLEEIRAQRIAVAVLVPTILHRLTDAAGSVDAADGAGAARPGPVRSLRSIVCGSAHLPPALASRALATFGPVLFNLYGASETGLVTLATPADLADDPATVGRVLPGTVVTIVGDDGYPMPTGESGRIVVGGAQVGRGTAVDTGDLGHLDEHGRLTISGRSDDLVIRGGEKFFVSEIEARVAATLAGGPVAELAVVVEPDEGTDFGSTLHLFVAAPGGSCDMETIANRLATTLPRTIRPSRITLVDALPRTLKGEVSRLALVRSPTDNGDHGRSS